MVSVDIKHHVYLLAYCGSMCGQNPGEIKSWEAELGSRSWMDGFDADLFLSSCFSDTLTDQEQGGGAGLS